MSDYPVLTTLPTIVSGNGHHRALAIVGSHPATRENAPYDDPRFEIWLFNEAAQKPEIYRRWDALLQIHLPEVYRSEENYVNRNHWKWLQEKRGKPIFMQHVDPDVPDSVEYPLEVSDVDIVLAPPFTSIAHAAEMTKHTNIMLAAQDVFYEEKGAYTGEISPSMLTDVSCKFVIIGHSERRQYFNETDEIVNRKIKTAQGRT